MCVGYDRVWDSVSNSICGQSLLICVVVIVFDCVSV